MFVLKVVWHPKILINILDNTNITIEKLVWTICHFASDITWVLQLLSIAMSTNDLPLHIQVCSNSWSGFRRTRTCLYDFIISFRSLDAEYALVNFIRSSSFVFNTTWNYFPAHSGNISKSKQTQPKNRYT